MRRRQHVSAPSTYDDTRRELASWEEFARRVDATLTYDGFGLSRKPRVVAKVEDRWTIVLETEKVGGGPYHRPTTYTVMRAHCTSRNSFRFTIHDTRYLQRVLRSKQARGVKTGDPEFDSHFTIESNDDLKMRELLANPRTRRLILRQPKVSLSLGQPPSTFKPGLTDIVWRMLRDFLGMRQQGRPLGEGLYFTSTDIIIDVDRLVFMHELFTEMLNQLWKMGCIEPPTQPPTPTALA